MTEGKHAARLRATIDGGERHLMVASLCYNDVFVNTDGGWLFSERLLNVDCVDERALA